MLAGFFRDPTDACSRSSSSETSQEIDTSDLSPISFRTYSSTRRVQSRRRIHQYRQPTDAVPTRTQADPAQAPSSPTTRIDRILLSLLSACAFWQIRCSRIFSSPCRALGDSKCSFQKKSHKRLVHQRLSEAGSEVSSALS